jgi:hypothetical protein
MIEIRGLFNKKSKIKFEVNHINIDKFQMYKNMV